MKKDKTNKKNIATAEENEENAPRRSTTRRDLTQTVEIAPPKKHKKKIIITVCVIVGVILIAVAGVFLYLHSLGINFMTREKTTKINSKPNYNQGEVDDDDERSYTSMISAITDDDDLSSILSGWYSSEGDLMQNKNILNVLIIGIDGTGSSKDMTGNSDVMMLCSIDKKNKKITLNSFLRDSWTYFENDGSGEYAKLNAAYAVGGPSCLVDAIENNYKIKIDYFVAVNFESFEKLIDAIGGINLTVTEDEKYAIEDYGHISGVPYGENVHLNGIQALLFSRMRKIYTSGDVQRTENQRRVINAIIAKAKANLSISTLSNAVSAVAPYVYTDCSSANILSLGTSAILGKWYDFEIVSMESPGENARMPYEGSQWIWVVDYPYAAQCLQKQIYGESNIIIPDDAVSALQVVEAHGVN